MSILLETERVILRAFEQNDLEQLVALDADPGVMRFRASGVPHSRARTETETLPYFLAPRGRLTTWVWSVLLKPTHEFIGLCALRPVDDGSNQASIGYRLMPSTWGAGLATEAARALVAHAFDDFGFDRIYGEAMAINFASRRVMEKAGLRYVRTFHVAFDNPIPGTEEGEVEYALTREEWLADHAT